MQPLASDCVLVGSERLKVDALARNPETLGTLGDLFRLRCLGFTDGVFQRRNVNIEPEMSQTG